MAFQTVGCRLNQAETAEFEAAFRTAGYRVVSFKSPCDVAVVHGCAVTAAAQRDSLRWARSARRRSPKALIVVAGCAAEQARRQGNAACGTVDLWIGQAEKDELALIVTRQIGAGSPPATVPTASSPPSSDHGLDLTVEGWRLGGRTRALVKVQDGCPFRCAYCIVPMLRPAPVSRPVKDIVEVVLRLADAGCREIVLTGANLGCYADGGRRLPDLLQVLASIEAGPRIRLSSIETAPVVREIVDAMAASDRICRYLHLPLQSGNDAVLERMQRRYRTADYRAAIAYALKKLPRPGLGTDIIVGFPGETDAEFENTLRLVEELPFSNLHVFPFSPRPGTAAARMIDSVPAAVKRERVSLLNRLGAAKRSQFAARQIGHPAEVLVERMRHGEGSGWTGEYLPARVGGPGVAVNRLYRLPVNRIRQDTVWISTV